LHCFRIQAYRRSPKAKSSSKQSQHNRYAGTATAAATAAAQDPETDRPAFGNRKPLRQPGRKLLTNVWNDQKAMWTSPFHTKPEDRKWWGLFGVGTAALVIEDRHLSDSISYGTTQVSFSKNISQIGADYTTAPLAVGLYFYGKWKDDAKARETGVLAGGLDRTAPSSWRY